eukprot:scaffold6781_cov204-Amphora_coffeaeformis.AAC.1
MEDHPKVVRVWPESSRTLLSSWDTDDMILAANTDGSTDGDENIPTYRQAWLQDYTGEDIVIGILDSGIVPENPSFADGPHPVLPDNAPYGPAPAHFTGTGCAFGNTKYNQDDAPFECQGKILAAKCYALSVSEKAKKGDFCLGDGKKLPHPDHFLSARDDTASGHGPHVAAIAAGNAHVQAAVRNSTATMTPTVLGRISGVAPRARLSIYKVCWAGSCGTSDTLAALEDALQDGVDVINYSIGGRFPGAGDMAFWNLVQAGVAVVASAGNAGPNDSSISFPAAYPWIMAVAALDDARKRQVIGLQVQNLSSSFQSGQFPASPPGSGGGEWPMSIMVNQSVLATEPPLACGEVTNDLTGKVALIRRGACNFVVKIQHAKAVGAVGVIVYNDGVDDSRMGLVTMDVEGTTLPSIFVEYNTGNEIVQALAAGETPLLSIVGASLENSVAWYSSRGPNDRFSTSVIKPDIMAPGTRILSASTPYAAGAEGDSGRNDFGLLSGTSMAGPHIAGAMALLAEAHPEWSVSVMKSAILTTARHEDLVRQVYPPVPASPFEIGSGVPRMQLALDPGLVYEISMEEYKAAYCMFDPKEMGDDCNQMENKRYDVMNLNYPSIAADMGELVSKTTVRTVTNVADETLVFTGLLESESGFDVTVSPCSFLLPPGESFTFEITFRLAPTNLDIPSAWMYGSLMWVGETVDPMALPPVFGGACATDAPQTRRFLRYRQKDRKEIQPLTKTPTSSPSTTPSATPSWAPSSSPFSTPTVSPSFPASLAPTKSPRQKSDSENLSEEEEMVVSRREYQVYSPLAVIAGPGYF